YIIIIIAFVVGVVIGRFVLRLLFKRQEVAAQNKAKKILKEAEQAGEHLKKQRQLEAKEKFLQLKAEHEKETAQKNNTLSQRENSIRQKEQSVNQKLESLNREKQELENQRKSLERLTEISRSEEHTSELQSREKLVCRRLLDKKQSNCWSPAALHRRRQ